MHRQTTGQARGTAAATTDYGATGYQHAEPYTGAGSAMGGAFAILAGLLAFLAGLAVVVRRTSTDVATSYAYNTRPTAGAGSCSLSA